jgi:hypothetical protein
VCCAGSARQCGRFKSVKGGELSKRGRACGGGVGVGVEWIWWRYTSAHVIMGLVELWSSPLLEQNPSLPYRRGAKGVLEVSECKIYSS